MKYSSIVFSALLIGGGATRGFGQSSAQFQIPITITNGSSVQLLTIGVSGDGDGGSIQDNTIGADVDLSFGSFQEPVAPPPPPPPFEFDARILTIPGRVSTFPTGLGGGVYKDFRGFSDGVAQVDSFRINMSGDGIDARSTTISWPGNLSTYGSSWIIRPQSGSEWSPVDMTTASSVEIPLGVLQRNTLIIKTGALTGIRPVDATVPERFGLEQNYPNPFNPATTIRFSVPEAGRVSLNVYNLIGQQVATLADGVFSPGTYSVQLRGEDLASGMYFYKLEAGTNTAIRKLTLLK